MKQDFYLAAGQSLSTALRFRARSAIVQNPGGQWVGFPDVAALIAPWRAGAVVPLPAVAVANVNTTPPPGQQNSGAGSQAVVSFTTEQLAAFAGNDLTTGLAPQTNQPLNPVSILGPPVGGSTWNIVDPTVIPVGSYYLSDVHLTLYGGAAGSGITAIVQITFQGTLIVQATVVGGVESGSGPFPVPWVLTYPAPRIIAADGLHSLTTIVNFNGAQPMNSCVVVYSYGLRKQAY